ncbi:MAG TPA: CHRD domain-containing protein [Anaerolineales bacterium]
MFSRQLSVSRKHLLRLLILVALLSLLVAVIPAAAQGRPFSTTLTGAAEVPGPGDPDGSGTAHISLNQGLGEVCFELVVEGIAPATASHIHFAPAGVAGGVVVPLTPPPTEGSSSACVSVDPDLIKAIRQNPEEYYVNVHNADFPAGALRGQLSK